MAGRGGSSAYLFRQAAMSEIPKSLAPLASEVCRAYLTDKAPTAALKEAYRALPDRLRLYWVIRVSLREHPRRTSPWVAYREALIATDARKADGKWRRSDALVRAHRLEMLIEYASGHHYSHRATSGPRWPEPGWAWPDIQRRGWEYSRKKGNPDD